MTHMRMTVSGCCVAALLLSPGIFAAERVVLRSIADNYAYATPWSSSAPEDSEAFDNHGGESQIVLKGREYFTLMLFDVSAVKGMVVERATLRLYLRSNPSGYPLSTVGLSTLSGNGPWAEGAQSPGRRAARGESNYYWARNGEQPWAYVGSDLSDVTFGSGGSLYTYVSPRDAGGGWYEIDVPPAFVYALTSGDQYGWVLSDERGQTWSRYSLSSREQTSTQPALIVEGTRAEQPRPGPVVSLRSGEAVFESTPEEARALGRTTLRPGSAVLHFGGAGGVRYELRYSREPVDEANFSSATPAPRWMLDPIAPKREPMAVSNALRDEVNAIVEDLEPAAVYYFAARATGSDGQSGPVSALGAYRAYSRTWPSLLEATAPAAPAGETSAAPWVWAVPELVKIDPRTGALVEQDDYPGHRASNPVWDASTATVRLSGARNEFVAFQLAVEAPRPLSAVNLSVAEPLFADASLPGIFRSTSAVQFYREWFVPDDQDTSPSRPWYPDPLIPLAGAFDIPARDNAVPGQTVQPAFVDIYIPHDAAPGLHTGRLRVTAAPDLVQDVIVQVEVLPFTLPDQLNFTVDLNAYGGVGSGYNVRTGTPEYRALVHSYHRMAHLHRANLDVLGYSHSGSVEPDYSPPLTGEGGDTRVADWTDWDAHFGPLASGAAFADLPRAGVPVPNLYLNFFENWPGDLRANYKWDNYPRPSTTQEYKDMIARHGLEAGPVEEGLTQAYQDRFSAVAADFAAHFRERGWTSTRYLVYFNNKYYYKDPAQGGRGVSWWLLDEPNFRDDFRALSFLGWLAKRGLRDYPDVPILFRTDISYIDFSRDLLTGQVDIQCTSKRFFSRNRYLMDHRDRLGASYWNYASTNHPRESNVAMRSWCWRVWAAGGDGIVPWNAVVGSQAWERAEPLTVFYTGTKLGRNEPFGSLRLKAYRRGQQDVEYLVLLSRQPGWDREAVAKAVADASIGDLNLEGLRRRVASTIAAPAETPDSGGTLRESAPMPAGAKPASGRASSR